MSYSSVKPYPPWTCSATLLARRAARVAKRKAIEASGANCSSSSSCAHAASRARSRAPSTRVAASARSRAIDWYDPMGTPNCTRSLAYSTPMARAASPRPTSAPLIRVRHSSSGHSVGRPCDVPGGEDGAARSPERAVGQGRRPEVGRADRWPSPVRRATSSSPSMATTARATGPKVTSLAVPPRRDGGRSWRRWRARRSGRRGTRHPGRRTTPGSGRPRRLDEGHRGEEAADLFADEFQIEQGGPSAAQFLGDADGGTGQPEKASHRSASNPVDSLARTTSAAQWSSRKARTAATSSCCSSVRFRSMVGLRPLPGGGVDSSGSPGQGAMLVVGTGSGGSNRCDRIEPFTSGWTTPTSRTSRSAWPAPGFPRRRRDRLGGRGARPLPAGAGRPTGCHRYDWRAKRRRSTPSRSSSPPSTAADALPARPLRRTRCPAAAARPRLAGLGRGIHRA